jgi:DNA-binding CsgD family transcriptional regulator
LLAGRVRILVAVRTDDPGARVALALCDSLGATRVEPQPLDTGTASALLRTLRPDLGEAHVRRIVERARGNPLFLHELAVDGEVSPSFRLALAARVRTLSPTARDALAVLALLGRPAAPELLGAGVDELVDREFADAADGVVAIRHSLFGEIVVENLDDETRRAIHGRLGDHVGEPAEAAHHLAAAGRLADAKPIALAAAEAAATRGERAELLGLAATCSEGAERRPLTLRAARELGEGGQYVAAERLLDSLGELTGNDRAEMACIRWATRYELGDLDGAHAEVAAGLAALDESPELETELRLAEASLANLDEGSTPEERLNKATAALELARRHGFRTARAAYLYGTALYVAGDPRCLEELERAADEGRRTGDVTSELTAIYNGVAAGESHRRQDEARALASAGAQRARSLRLPSWDRQFRASLVNLDAHAGKYDDVVRDGTALIEEGLDRRRRDAVEIAVCVALVDLGRFEQSAARIAQLLAVGASDVRGQGLALWLQAESDLWGGRPRAALKTIERFLALPDAGVFEPFGRVVEGWARFELELSPVAWEAAWLAPILTGVPHELAGLRLLGAGAAEEAGARFREGAELFAGSHLRGELRCLLGEGLAAVAAGEREHAQVLLLALEQRAEAHGMEPLLARVRRGLRLAGVQRTAPRRRATGGLTAREAEVLELAAGGLTNEAIAARLGVGRSTVKRLVASGARKLGAATRAQAVARFVRA